MLKLGKKFGEADLNYEQNQAGPMKNYFKLDKAR